MKRFPTVLALSLAVLSTSPLYATWDSGVSAFRDGRYEEAASVFQDFVERSPEAPEGHYMLGMTRLRQQRLDESIGAFGKALDLGPSDARYTLALAQAQLKASRADDALATLGTTDPKAVPATMRSSFDQLLAKAANVSRRDSQAEEILERALAASPKSKPLWLASANVAQRRDRPEKRFEALSTVFELDADDTQAGSKAAHSAIAIAQNTGDPGLRTDWYQRASSLAHRLTASSPTAEHWMLAGGAAMGGHEYELALGSFEKARAAGDDSLELDYYVGRTHLALGQNEEALRYLQATLDRSPDAAMTASVHAARGLAYRKLEQFDQAAAAFRLAGDTVQAEEMAGYAANRREWALAKAECHERQQKIQELRQGSQELEGTPEWDELEQEFSDILTACKPYLQDVG